MRYQLPIRCGCLFKVKKQNKEGDEGSNANQRRPAPRNHMIKRRKTEENDNTRRPVPKTQSPAELRVYKEITELKLPKTYYLHFLKDDDLMNFHFRIQPLEGYYRDGMFHFSIQVPPSYPHEPPKVKSISKVYHPNIDLEGNVCLNILRKDWKPDLNISTVLHGLNELFTHPNYEEPLNKQAAALLRYNPQKFEKNVQFSIAGRPIDQHTYSRCVRPGLHARLA